MVKLLQQNGWAKYASNYLVGVDFSKKSAEDGIAMFGFRIKHGAAISVSISHKPRTQPQTAGTCRFVQYAG